MQHENKGLMQRKKSWQQEIMHYAYYVCKTLLQNFLSGRGQSALVGGAIWWLLLPHHILRLIPEAATQLHTNKHTHIFVIGTHTQCYHTHTQNRTIIEVTTWKNTLMTTAMLVLGQISVVVKGNSLTRIASETRHNHGIWVFTTLQCGGHCQSIYCTFGSSLTFFPR